MEGKMELQQGLLQAPQDQNEEGHAIDDAKLNAEDFIEPLNKLNMKRNVEPTKRGQ